MDRLQVPNIGRPQQQQKVLFDNLKEVKLIYTINKLWTKVYLTDEKIHYPGDFNVEYKKDLKVAVDLNTGELHVLSGFAPGKDLKLESLHISSIIQWTYGRDEGKESVNSLSFLVKC